MSRPKEPHAEILSRHGTLVPMHEFTSEVQGLADEVLAYSLHRLKTDPPLDGPRSATDLYAQVGNTITEKGLGGHRALEVFTSVLAKHVSLPIIRVTWRSFHLHLANMQTFST